MRIARIEVEGREDFALRADDATWIPLSDIGIAARTTGELLAQRKALASIDVSGRGLTATDVTFLAPIVSPTKILAVGLNYISHTDETNSQQPETPMIFAKFPNSLNGPHSAIIVDSDLTDKPDYEVELAAVIGRRAKGVSEEDALDYVFGYAVANDVSARDWQRRDGQFCRSKSFDTFAPIGPWITTADEVADPQKLSLQSTVNGEMRQHSTTSDMVFSIAHLIWYLSRGLTLLPGDVLLTGTPEGVGFAMDPPQYLLDGDIVECEIEGLGTLRNPVVVQ